MGLIIDLKANEKIIVGDAVISAADVRTKINIQGEAPILREKDVMTPEKADTPCKQLYLIVQLMYLSKDAARFYDDYFKTLKEIQDAAPSCTFFFLTISERILEGDLYRALKEAKKLIEHEAELIGRELNKMQEVAADVTFTPENPAEALAELAS